MAKKAATPRRGATPAATKQAKARRKTATQIRRNKKAREAKLVATREAARARWLKAYAVDGTVTGACRASKVSRGTHYVWIETDESYRAAVAAAKEQAIDALEREARKRALNRSDTLLIFLLKGERPDKYRDKWEGKISGEIAAAMIDPTTLKNMTTSELETAMTLFKRMLGEKPE